MKETKTLHFKIQAKGITKNTAGQEVGQIEAYGAVFNNIDDGNDRILPGAFKRTIQNSKARAKSRERKYVLPMLWQHNEQELIGGWYDLSEDSYGLLCKGEVALATQRGREYYELAKAGMTDQFSIIYDVPSGGARYDKSGVRDLSELRLFSVDPVTFAMNDATYMVGVKSASGKTTWPLAPDDTKWDGGQATKDIEAWADGDWSKVAQCFFWVASSPPKTLDDCKLPFVAKVNGKMMAVPRGIIACTGSHGLDAVDIPDADMDGVKKKIASYYKKMKMTPPWESSESGKTRGRRSMDKKDFNDRYRQQCISDWQYDDWQALVIALKQSVMDAFASGDEPELDLVDIILNDADDSPGFISALKDYVQRGIDLDYSNYLQEQQSGGYGDSYYGYMSRNNPNRKANRAFSQDNTDAIHGHVAALHDMADEQAKAMHDAADGLLEALQGLGAPSDPSYRQQGTTTDDEKTNRRARRSGRKAGAEYSADNLQMLGEHIGDLHDVADTIHQMAEDLAENTGAQTYSDSDGTSDDASETDKNKANSRFDALGRKHSPAVGTAVDAGDVSTALSRLNNLTIVK